MKLFDRPYRHLTPRYVMDRLGVMHQERRKPDAPWLTAASVEILESWLRVSDVGLEWGSGRSTLWFAKRTSLLHSVEHDVGWGQRVSAQLDGEPSLRVKYHLAEDGTSGRPDSAYVGVVRLLDDESVDYCLVDGVSRDHCANAALDKLKPGGLLIVDNANWYIPRSHPSRAPGSRSLLDGFASAEWALFAQRVGGWRCIWTTNGVTDTAIWVRAS